MSEHLVVMTVEQQSEPAVELSCIHGFIGSHAHRLSRGSRIRPGVRDRWLADNQTQERHLTPIASSVGYRPRPLRLASVIG